MALISLFGIPWNITKLIQWIFGFTEAVEDTAAVLMGTIVLWLGGGNISYKS